MKFNQSTSSASNHIWTTALWCLLFLTCICISIGVWKHRQLNNPDQRTSQIMYIPNRQRDDLQIDFNAEQALLSRNSVDDDSVSIETQSSRPTISDNMKQQFRRSKQFLHRFSMK